MLTTFYFLKKRMYTECVDTIKRDLLRYSTTRSWREKRSLFELRKESIQCLGCHGKGGNIFYESIDSTTKNRILHSRCGGSRVGCAMNMDISVGSTKELISCLREEEGNVDKYKREIIISKNNLLFGIQTTDEVVSIFQKLKKQLGHTATTLHSWYGFYRHKFANPETLIEREKRETDMIDALNKWQQLQRDRRAMLTNTVSGMEMKEHQKDIKNSEKDFVKETLKYQTLCVQALKEQSARREELSFATDESKLGLQLDKSVIEELKKGFDKFSLSSSSSSSSSLPTFTRKTKSTKMMNKTLKLK